MKHLALLLAMLVAIACHHDAEPAHPEAGEKPPLASSTGTPVGYLIDGAEELQLSGNQIVKLEEIDTALAAKLGILDKQMRAAKKPPPEQSNAPAGGMRGGMRGGGMRGMGGGGGRRRTSQGSGSGSASSRRAGAAGRLDAERTAEVRDAIQHAMTLLTPAQQSRAKKILEDHDVDLDDEAPVPVLSGSSSPVPASRDTTPDEP